MAFSPTHTTQCVLSRLPVVGQLVQVVAFETSRLDRAGSGIANNAVLQVTAAFVLILCVILLLVTGTSSPHDECDDVTCVSVNMIRLRRYPIHRV